MTQELKELYEEQRAAKRIGDMYEYYKENHLKDPPCIIELEEACNTATWLFTQLRELKKQYKDLERMYHLQGINYIRETKKLREHTEREAKLVEAITAFIEGNVSYGSEHVTWAQIFMEVLEELGVEEKDDA